MTHFKQTSVWYCVLGGVAGGAGLGYLAAKLLAARTKSAEAELLYFDARGAGETTRLLYAAAGASEQLSDRRWSADFSKMSQGIQVAAPEFAAAKANGSLAANLNRAPVLSIDGASIGQSSAIERLVASRLGLYGATDIESAQCDMIVEHLADIKKTYQDAKKKAKAAAEEGDDKAVEQWFETALQEWFFKLEACLGATRGFAVGSRISWADAKIYVFVREYFDDLDAVARALTPKVKASADGFAAAVSGYVAQRKVTPI